MFFICLTIFLQLVMQSLPPINKANVESLMTKEFLGISHVCFSVIRCILQGTFSCCCLCAYSGKCSGQRPMSAPMLPSPTVEAVTETYWKKWRPTCPSLWKTSPPSMSKLHWRISTHVATSVGNLDLSRKLDYKSIVSGLSLCLNPPTFCYSLLYSVVFTRLQCNLVVLLCIL